MINGAPPGVVAEIWERDEYRVSPHLSEGVRVIDVGAHVGTFTLYAAVHGAQVLAVEPWIPHVMQLIRNITTEGLDDLVQVRWAAAGATDGVCGFVRKGLGVQTGPGDTVPQLSLQTLLDGREVDVLKVDAEGAEYDLLLGADLSLVRYLTLELHIWATPDDPKPGLGLRDYPMPHTPHELVDWIDQTHRIELNGNLEEGGYLYATRR